MRKQRQTKSLIVEERGGASFGVLPFFCRKAVLYMVKGAQTIAQYKIMRWIDEHFTDVEIKPQKADSVKITDSVGGCMIITINAAGDVIDALSGEILDREGAGYEREEKRPQRAHTKDRGILGP